MSSVTGPHLVVEGRRSGTAAAALRHGWRTAAADGVAQGRRDSNPQPPVLETGALPIAPLPSGRTCRSGRARRHPERQASRCATTGERVYASHRPGSNRSPVRSRGTNQAGSRPVRIGARIGGRDQQTTPSDPASVYRRCSPAPARRISPRIGAIAESATLAVDARAKALKAAGRPVIGFGAGEPDFPTPGYIVQAAIAACAASRRTTATPPPAGLPGAAGGHRGQDGPGLRLRGRAASRCW